MKKKKKEEEQKKNQKYYQKDQIVLMVNYLLKYIETIMRTATEKKELEKTI